MPETEHLVRFKFSFILFIFYFQLSAQTYPDYMVNYLLNSGIDDILFQNYDAAEEKFIRLEKEFSNLPLGKIFQSAVLITKSVDYNSFNDDERIYFLLEKAEEQSDSLLNISKGNVWHHYFKALSVGYQSYFSALKSNYFNAFASAITSLEHFEECLEIDSLFYESYTALGSYLYWKSAKTEFLNWMPFFEDNREIGIVYLESAFEYATYHKHLAAYSLVWIYIDMGEFEKAISTAEKFLEKFPYSRFFLEGAARAFEEIDRRKSIEYYEKMIESLPINISTIVINKIILLHKIAMQHEKLGNNKKALALCDEILSITIDENFQEILEDRLERVQQLKKKLEENN